MSVRATNVLGGVRVGGVRVVVGTDYEALRNKPKINGVELYGDKTAADLGLGDATDYEALDNKPSINGVELDGDKSLEDLGIPTSGGTSYEFTEGDTDGAFEVKPEGGEAQTVKVHGLQEFCFEDVLSEDEILTILNHDKGDEALED